MKRIVVSLVAFLLGWGSVTLQASVADSIRKRIPALHGKARLMAYERLYQLSKSSDDVYYQVRCFNDYIAELRRFDDSETKAVLATRLVERAVLFYNCDMTDSIYLHVPEDRKTLRQLGDENRYYEIWTHLVNTQTFDGKPNLALREVQQMFADAKAHDSKYGMGIAYYVMGNVYSNLHNLDECVASYRKSIELLQDLSPQPPALVEIYSYYGDVLNDKGDYQQLQQLTVGWKRFLEKFIADSKLAPAMADLLWSYYYVACAQVALGQQRLDDAATMLAEVRKRIPSESDYVGMTWLFYSTQLNLQRGDYKEALRQNDHRLLLMNLTGDNDMFLTIANQRAEILKHLGRYEEVAALYQQIIHVKDSINGTETKNQLNEMNTLFHVDELKMEQERAQFRNTLIIIGIILLALVVFTIFRIRSARRLKKAHNELLVAYDQLEETTTAKERIESDLRIARNIQMGMVPSTFPERPDLDLYASMTPAKEVGGDLYGYQLMGDKLYFALGDVSGKGVPASLFMAQATRLFRTLAAQEMMPAEIATRINDALSGEDNETGMFVTMFLGLVDLTTGHLDFCNAGHNPPVLLTDGKSEFIEMEPNAPIGLWPGLDYVGEEIADIAGRPLFVYTDGLNEAENRQQDQFTDERLLEILETHPFESSRQTIELLRNEVERHRDGADPNDDLTMLCVLVKPQL